MTPVDPVNSFGWDHVLCHYLARHFPNLQRADCGNIKGDITAVYG